MTEKKLLEIRESLEMQWILEKKTGYSKLSSSLQLDIDLYQEIMRLREVINKAKEFASGHAFQTDGDKDFETLLKILSEVE